MSNPSISMLIGVKYLEENRYVHLVRFRGGLS